VAWLPPELEIGEEPELKPPEPEFVLEEPDPVEPEPDPVELEPVEPEPVEPEPVELEPVEPELELAEEEPDEVEPDPLDVLDLCVDPGRARASAPAVTTLAMVTAVVVDRTLARPRSLAARAWRIPSSRRALLMSLILRSGFRESLHESSREPMSRAGSSRSRGPRLPANHEGHLKEKAEFRSKRVDAAFMPFQRNTALACCGSARAACTKADTSHSGTVRTKRKAWMPHPRSGERV
jgi:hypothetical protein